MALKATEIKITFDLEAYTWADSIDVQSGDDERFLNVIGRLGRIKGKNQEEVRGIVGQVRMADAHLIIDMLADAIRSRTDPSEDDSGKN